jgi:hypothetical protein
MLLPDGLHCTDTGPVGSSRKFLIAGSDVIIPTGSEVILPANVWQPAARDPESASPGGARTHAPTLRHQGITYVFTVYLYTSVVDPELSALILLPGSRSLLGMRTRIQEHGNCPRKQNKPVFLPFKRAFVTS